MRGLLRGVMAVGLLAGGGLGAGCTDQRPETGAFKTPIQDKYQPPEAEAREPLGGDERLRHPDQERWTAGDEHPERAGGTVAPSTVVGTEEMGTGGAGIGQALDELGLGLAESYQAEPAQGGAGQSGQAAEPRPQQAPSPEDR